MFFSKRECNGFSGARRQSTQARRNRGMSCDRFRFRARGGLCSSHGSGCGAMSRTAFAAAAGGMAARLRGSDRQQPLGACAQGASSRQKDLAVPLDRAMYRRPRHRPEPDRHLPPAGPRPACLYRRHSSEDLIASRIPHRRSHSAELEAALRRKPDDLGHRNQHRAARAGVVAPTLKPAGLGLSRLHPKMIAYRREARSICGYICGDYVEKPERIVKIFQNLRKFY